MAPVALCLLSSKWVLCQVSKMHTRMAKIHLDFFFIGKAANVAVVL